jgi:hypothetical protein
LTTSCASDEEKEYLKIELAERGLNLDIPDAYTKIIYRGSEHGWTAYDYQAQIEKISD